MRREEYDIESIVAILFSEVFLLFVNANANKEKYFTNFCNKLILVFFERFASKDTKNNPTKMYLPVFTLSKLNLVKISYICHLENNHEFICLT